MLLTPHAPSLNLKILKLSVYEYTSPISYKNVVYTTYVVSDFAPAHSRKNEEDYIFVFVFCSVGFCLFLVCLLFFAFLAASSCIPTTVVLLYLLRFLVQACNPYGLLQGYEAALPHSHSLLVL